MLVGWRLTVVLLGAVACQRPLPPAALATASNAFPTYEISFAADGATVHVDATYPVGFADSLRANPATTPYFRDVEVERQGAWMPVALAAGGWAACTTACRVRYAFALREAARELDDHDYAQRFGTLFLAPPGSFLLRPEPERHGTPFRFHVTPSSTVGFVTGVLPTGAANTYQAELSDLANLPYTGIGQFRAHTVHLADASLEVAIAGATPDVGDARLLAWIETSAQSIRGYFGRFALARAAVILLVDDGNRIDGAMTMGNGGGSVLIRVGKSTPERELDADWQMTHEMVHLSMPNLPEAQRWFEEGLATYIEPLARARAGRLGAEQVWAETLRGMRYALPRAGEGGLDETHTWARTYWAGALFVLLADVRIREQTGNARSLDDALEAVQAAGGSVAVRWSMQRMIEVGDAATGTTVLRDLYASMGHAALQVDLAQLWKELGIRSDAHGRVGFDATAPLAAIRASMTATQSN